MKPPKIPSKRKELVVKSNQLINASYHLTVSEMRLFLLMISQIQPTDSDFKTYRVDIKDIAEKSGVNHKDLYKIARESSKMLMTRVMEISQADGSLQVAFLSAAKYVDGKGYVELRFDPGLKPYLLELKNRFTSYNIRNVMSLQSAHSIRIYELLKQYEGIGSRSFDIEDLKAILGVQDQYSRNNDFKRFVIDRAKRELEKNCDLYFSYKEIKEGRKIVGLEFNIISKEKQKGNAAEQAPEVVDPLFDALTDIGLSRKITRELIDANDREWLSQLAAHTKKGFSEGVIQKPAGYFLKLVSERAELKSPLETKKRNNEQAQRQKVAQRKSDDKMIEQLQYEFDIVWKALQNEAIERVTEDEIAAFYQYVNGNVLLRKRLMDDGVLNRKHEEYEEWLGYFLINQRFSKEEAFVQWASSKKGIILQRMGANEFRVVGRQENLFN